ncbi:DUF418 domain-containing protein [Salicibibacter cibi]|uniref:DUF418 domain-containing protein n=1 Tax=Salicibibacter cibi TaxID=2743001 RepID=A0A7T7CEN6_9BACI|nr:DUF418 domain-containing protein [Salicibibacter cibi]QQK79214.1 DUF418 domain-containing protein [Salicibibacter cibi]
MMNKIHAKEMEGNHSLARGSVSNNERSLAPDLARGFMLLMIALAHAPLWLDVTETNLLGRPEGGGALSEVINFVSALFVDNRAVPMFAALFGYGMAKMVTRQLSAGTLETESRRLLWRRSLFLLLFGFIHLVFIGGIDILAFYGFSGLLIGWMLFRRDRILIKAILLVLLFSLILIPVVWIGVAYGYGMDIDRTNPDAYLEAMLANLIRFPFRIMAHLFMHPILLPILVGIWAARKNLLNGTYHRQLLIRIAIIGISFSVMGALPLAMIGTQWWEPQPMMVGLSTALQMLSGLAGGFGYLAVFGLISPIASRTGRFTRSLVALGKRSLTFYVFNETMLVIIMSPVVFGMGQVLNSPGAFVVAVVVWMISLILAAVLECKGMRGPVDALLRRLIYRTSS